MKFVFRWSLGVALLSAAFANAQEKYKIQLQKSAPPKELNANIAKQLDGNSVKLLTEGGKLIGEFWFRKAIPANVKPDKVKKGIGYRDLRETEIIGAMRITKLWRDYRRQKVKPGVYTLRIGFQPVDGNHINASLHENFCVAISASMDNDVAPMATKKAVMLSMKSIKTGHPAILMLFPPTKKIPATPQIAAEEMDHWVINAGLAISVQGQNAGRIGFRLGVAGAAEE